MRFLHKFSSINYKFFGLVNGFLLNSKQKTNYASAIKYLNKYSYILDKNEILETSEKYKNKIWQCWFQGKENMPDIVRKCTDTVKKYHNDNIIFLDNSNIFDYIELPDYIIEKHKKGIIPYANYSDMLRLTLLSKYGGCWVDSTIYLTEKIPDDILNADFFTFQSLHAALLPSMNTVNQVEMYSNNFNEVISIESPYFIRAKSGNEIINAVRNLFFEYWKHEDSVKDYLMIDKFFILAVLQNKKLKEQFMNMPKYYIENVLLLQYALFEPYNQELFNNIASSSNVHKLTHKNLTRNPYKNSFLKYILNN